MEIRVNSDRYDVDVLLSLCRRCRLENTWSPIERCRDCDTVQNNKFQNSDPIVIELFDGTTIVNECNSESQTIKRLREVAQQIKEIGFEEFLNSKICHCDWGRFGHHPLNCEFRNLLEEV